VLNGVVAVPLMVVMMIMDDAPAGDGRFSSCRGPLWVMGWLSTAVMAFTVLTMLATW